MQLGFTINRRPFVHDLISGFDQNKASLLSRVYSSHLAYWISFQVWVVLFLCMIHVRPVGAAKISYIFPSSCFGVRGIILYIRL